GSHRLSWAASSAAAQQDQASIEAFFASGFFVVLADADDVRNVILVFFLVREEGVVVIAQIDVFVFVVVECQIARALRLIVGIFERNDIGAVFVFEFLLFSIFILFDDRRGAAVEV